MTKLNLHRKFFLAVSPLLIVILVFGVVGIHTLAGIRKNFSKLNQDVTQSALAMMELKTVLISLESVVSEGTVNIRQIAGSIDQLKNLVKKHLAYETHSHEQSKKTAHDMMHHAVRIMSLSQYIMNQTEAGGLDGELAGIYEAVRQEYKALGPILDEHLAIHLRELAKTEEFVARKYFGGLVIVCVAIGTTILLTFGMLIYLIRSVLEPVKALQEGAKQIGNGNLDYNLIVKTGDELEELAAEFQDMAGKLAQSRALLDRKVRERTRELSEVNSELRKEINERKQAEEEQRRAEEQVHVLTQELIKVQENERQQIALDLHDNVAQELSSLKVVSENIFDGQALSRQELQRNMAEWATLLKRCINTIRELSYNLRPPGLEQMGVKSAVFDYCRSFAKKNGILVDFFPAGIDNLHLDYNFSINLYRLIQEALNNIKKHAHASRVSVRLVASFPNIILRIEDDGFGFVHESWPEKALRKKRLGLLGMQERVRLLHGTFKIHSRPGEGTKIFIEIPLEAGNIDVG